MTVATQWRAYLRRARELPPHLVAQRALGLAMRCGRSASRSLRDRYRPSTAIGAPIEIRRVCAELTVPRDPALLQDLGRQVRQAIDHRVDLLGTGPVSLDHGAAAPGLEGYVYPLGPTVTTDGDGVWLVDRINPANLLESRRLWRLVPAGYQPIDWQRDLRSGYRWSSCAPSASCRVAPAPGVDIKMPWELARLQHLPQLAMAYTAARRLGTRCVPSPDACASEVRAQILDFLATNPPRFGVNWVCPMDVGIRIANMLVAVDLLRAAGWQADAPFLAALGRATVDHGRHILAHLEWSDGPRSNHYLADLAGLAFCGAYLPAATESDGWLAFAAHQLAMEIPLQTLADGGNHEGSTNYHRLSGELLVFAVAVLAAVAEDRRTAFHRPPPAPHRVRPNWPQREVEAPLPPLCCNRLAAMGRAMALWQRPDGRFPQIGDTDSGRFFRLDPVMAADNAPDPLDQRGSLDAFAALFGDPVLRAQAEGPRAEGRLVEALTRNRPLPAKAPQSWLPLPTIEAPQRMLAQIEMLPDSHRQRHAISLPGLAPGALIPAFLPDFGVYGVRGTETLILLRIPDYRGRSGLGHTHDDALHLEVWHAGRCVITDPGSYVYTPLPERRALWRAAEAHFAPRPKTGVAALEPRGLFDVGHRAHATCLWLSADAIAGRLYGPGWTIDRVVWITDGALTIVDGCADGPLAPSPGECGPVRVSDGYGRLTNRLVYDG